MKKFRFLILALTLAMLLPVFAGCKKDAPTPDGNDSEETEELDGDRLELSIPKENNNNREFRVLTTLEHADLDAVNENYSTKIEQEVYEANAAVEEHFGIVIVTDTIAGNYANRSVFNTRLLTQSLTSKSDYDLIAAETSASYAYALQNNLVKDFTTINSINLDNPWYLQNMVGTYGINGKLFGVRSDASLTTYADLDVIFFNEDLVESQNDFISPYEYVKNGEWYAEQMFGMALEFSSANTDGESSILTDSFGYVAQHVASRGFLTAFGAQLTVVGDDGNTYLAPEAPSRFNDMYDYLYGLFENNPSYLYVQDSTETDGALNAFKEGRALFYNGFLNESAKFRGVTWDYGVVPIPKYDEVQKEFYTPAGTQSVMFMIMHNTKDAELSGKVLEVKSYYFHYDVVPEYYDITLKTQYARDPRHSEMLDIIRQSTTLSFFGAMTLTMTPDPYNMFQMNSYWRNDKIVGAIATYYDNNVESWNTTLENLYKKLS